MARRDRRPADRLRRITTDVFIECALFDPVRIALTGRRHQIVSARAKRFERGIDPALMPATRWRPHGDGARPVRRRGRRGHPGWQPASLAAHGNAALRTRRGTGRLRHHRRRSGYLATAVGLYRAIARRNRVTVAVPSWRNDVAAPIVLEQSDTLAPALAAKAAEGCGEIETGMRTWFEEVLRLRGLDAVPPVSLPRASPVPLATLAPPQVRTELARRGTGPRKDC